MGYSDDSDDDKLHLEESLNELEHVADNLEESVNEQSRKVRDEEPLTDETHRDQTSVGARFRNATGGLKERFSRSTSEDEDFGELDKDTSRRRALKIIAGGGAILAGLGAIGGYRALANDDYDFAVNDNEAINEIAGAYSMSQDENLESLGVDLEEEIENEDRDYQLGFSDTILDNTIHLNANSINQREYSDLDSVTYSQALGIAEEISEDYEG